MADRRVPMVLRTRPWTPEERVLDPDTGRTVTRFTVKRVCNGCGALLGDATTDELFSYHAPDVRTECPFCRREANRG